MLFRSIVAADPYMDMTDFRSKRGFNTLTLANGGAAVRIRKDTDVYPTNNVVSDTAKGNKVLGVGLGWTPVDGLADSYADGFYRVCAKSGAQQLKDASMGDERTLEGFLRFAKEGFPADHRMLLFWDHGGGSLGGCCFDEK